MYVRNLETKLELTASARDVALTSEIMYLKFAWHHIRKTQKIDLLDLYVDKDYEDLENNELLLTFIVYDVVRVFSNS